MGPIFLKPSDRWRARKFPRATRGARLWLGAWRVALGGGAAMPNATCAAASWKALAVGYPPT